MSEELIELVRHAQSANQTAIEMLVRHYQTPAVRVAQNILGDLLEAEDAVQEAWLLALRNLAALQNPASFGGWFYRIVANVALRKRQQRNARPKDVELLETLVCPEALDGIGEERLPLLPLALNALSNKDHIVVMLHYFGAAPLAAIAQLLEISQGTVKRRLHHARQILRKEIQNMTKQASNRPAHLPADFRKIITGMRGNIDWNQIFTGSFNQWRAENKPIAADTTPNHWALVGKDGLVGEEYKDGSRLTYGESTWQDIELSLLVTPLAGGNAQVLFRVDEARQRFYVLDLMLGWQAATVRRVDQDETGNLRIVNLSVVNYPLEQQREYAVMVAARDHSITTYIDGALVNQVTDGAWTQGKVGLTVWKAKTLYRDIQLRLLS